MSSPRRRGRRIPPKARGPRPLDRAGDADSSAAETPAAGSQSAGEAATVRPGTRAQNRAAKRAAAPRAKQVRRGGVGGRGGPSNLPLILLAIAALAIGAAVIAFGNPFGSPTPSSSPGSSAVAGACPTSQPPALPAAETRHVTIDTDLGDIVIKVDGALSPIAAGNFVALADCGFYDGVVFHRTAALGDGTPFVIQGGDPEGTGSGGPGYSIQDEPVTATYHRGTVAMARSQQPNSQGSQFFIVLDDKAAPPLVSANTYAIFGEVIAGMDVADAIFRASNGAELPDDPVVMNSVTVSTTPPPSPAPSSLPAASPPASSGIEGSPTPPPAQ